MKRAILSLLVVSVALVIGVSAFSKPSGSQVLSWATRHKQPRVKIDFARHKARGVKCNTCHFKHKDGRRHRKCKSCHTSPKMSLKAGHNLCWKCHKKRGGPRTCKGCHTVN